MRASSRRRYHAPYLVLKMLDVGLSRRFWTMAVATLVFLWVVRFGIWGSYSNVEEASSPPTSTKPILNSEPSKPNHDESPPPPEPEDVSEPYEDVDKTDIALQPTDTPIPSSSGPAEPVAPEKKYGKIMDKVATITDTQYTDRLIPLIMHFHAVLGPDWPIVFFTSNETLQEHILPLLSSPAESESETTTSSAGPPSPTIQPRDDKIPIPTPAQILSPPPGSASFRRAVERGSIDVRIIPDQFNLSSRDGVNIYLSRPWLYEQLAPATHMLVFQADAMICANSPRVPEDFFDYAWIGAPLHPRIHYYNGGLCLRNRTMILDILSEGALWEQDTLVYKNWTEGGEDIWFSKKMDLRGANLPSADVAMKFAAEHSWHVKPVVKGEGIQKEYENRPWGFHKVHVYARDKLEEIAEWCPEIALAAKGRLEPST
ncbi:hypothetical protein QBC37DRAFT_90883 [Rhypophila decipiens]|uniref:DUF5672 domain-containing protein n=1 Tax=Rhypophila decipiens TaxID=261697 RepID=A0AAN6YD95_9PEZI|nr:hypothetical protein QBC37DRAFT_90883 [Rhypophila decipiens]